MFYYNKIFNVIEFWLTGLIILFPLIFALCKSAKKGDDENKLIENQYDQSKSNNPDNKTLTFDT